MSESKRWIIGLIMSFSSVAVAAAGLLYKMQEDSKPKPPVEPQQIVVKIDDIKSLAGGVAEAAMNVKVGENPSDETKKQARDQARKQAMDDAFKKKVQEVRATKKVDDKVADQVLAEDPASFFAAEPEVVKEEIVEGVLHVEYRFQFDEDKLQNALAAVKEVKNQLKKCDGTIGPDHQAHRMIVLYRDMNMQITAPTTQSAHAAVGAIESALRDKGVQLVDPQIQNEFYAKVKAGASKMLGPNDFLDLAVEAEKMPCYLALVQVEVTPQPGSGPDGSHSVKASMSVTCQDVEGNVIGAGMSKAGTRNFTGDGSQNSMDMNAAKVLKEGSGFAIKELWDSAGPVLTGR